MNRLRTILLTILIAVAYGAAGQGYVIDSVCQGAERHYRIDGETGSTYTWTLTDPQGTITTLPETADTITINWNKLPGNYILSTLQTSIHGCDSLELGTIKVFENPEITQIQPFNSSNFLANGYAIVKAGSTIQAVEYSLNGVTWQSSNVFKNLKPATYTAWVRNRNGCIVSEQFTILSSIVGEVKIKAGDVANCISLPIEIPIKAYDFNDISGFTIQVAFDPNLMTFNNLSRMNNLLSHGTLTETFPSPGMLEISFVSTNPFTLSNAGELFNLNFDGIASGHTELKWNLLNCLVLSATKTEMPTIYTNGAVEIRPFPQIYTAGGNAYCEGTPLTLNAGSYTGQVLTYQWTSPDGTTHTGSEWNLGPLEFSDVGEYQVKASDGPTCSTTEKLNVMVYPNPQVRISDADTLCSEKEVRLNAGAGFDTYKWQDGSTEPQLVATSEGIYWVVVSDNNGCKAVDSVFLHQCDMLIMMPNAFTPGVGVNNKFIPKYRTDVDINFQMYIFNKWGEQLFGTNNINEGWDGTYKGKLCQEDLYTWTIIFSTPGNQKFLQKSPQSGTVMLLIK